MARLSDYDLTVLVEEGAKAAWDKEDFDTPWEEIGPMGQNSIREQVLPVIYKATMKLEELGWVKPKKFYSSKELETAEGHYFRDSFGEMWHRFTTNDGRVLFSLADRTSMAKPANEMRRFPWTEV